MEAHKLIVKQHENGRFECHMDGSGFREATF